MAPDDTVYSLKQNPEADLEEADMVKASSQCCDYVAKKTGLEREACKSLLYAMIYGAHVIGVIGRHGLTLYDVANIRMAFDDWVEGR